MGTVDVTRVDTCRTSAPVEPPEGPEAGYSAGPPLPQPIRHALRLRHARAPLMEVSSLRGRSAAWGQRADGPTQDTLFGHSDGVMSVRFADHIGRLSTCAPAVSA
jgi:hypothetical protein